MLLTRKVALFAKIEGAYGVPEALAGADALRVHEPKLKPFVATTIERKLAGSGFGNTGKIHAGAHVEVEFDIEMAGSGTAGTPPPYGFLFKACKMVETITAATSTVYAPATDGTDSLTLYYELDGQRHALCGARGTWQIKFDSQGIPYFHFKFVGLWVDPLTAAPLLPVFAGWQTPRPVTFEHTPKIKLFGLDSVYKAFSCDYGGDVQYFNNPGEQYVDQMDRVATGSASLLAPVLADKNYFTTAKADARGSLLLVHGKEAGNIVTFHAPHTQLTEPDYGDDKGRATIEAKLEFCVDGVDDDLELKFT